MNYIMIIDRAIIELEEIYDDLSDISHGFHHLDTQLKLIEAKSDLIRSTTKLQGILDNETYQQENISRGIQED